MMSTATKRPTGDFARSAVPTIGTEEEVEFFVSIAPSAPFNMLTALEVDGIAKVYKNDRGYCGPLLDDMFTTAQDAVKIECVVKKEHQTAFLERLNVNEHVLGAYVLEFNGDGTEEKDLIAHVLLQKEGFEFEDSSLKRAELSWGIN